MEKYMIYEYQEDGVYKVGMVDSRIRPRYSYDNNIIPIRYRLVECTKKGIHALYQIFNNDLTKFREIIEEELSDALTYYSN